MIVDGMGGTILSKRVTSAATSTVRIAPIMTSSNTGLPGAYRAPVVAAPVAQPYTPPPADTSGRTLGRRPAPAPTPITSAQLPSLPTPSAPPPIVASGGAGASGGPTGYPDLPSDPPKVSYDAPMAATSSSLLTPRNIAIGAGLAVLAVIAVKRLR